MANKKGSRQLTWTDRISIEALKKAGHSVIEIAEQLGVHRSTISVSYTHLDVYKRQVIALERTDTVAGMTTDDIAALKGVLKQYE